MKLRSSHYLILLLTVGGAAAFVAASMSKRGQTKFEKDFADLEQATEDEGRTADTAQDAPAAWYDSP